MFSIFKKQQAKRTRLVKFSGSTLPQYMIQERSGVTGWSNAEPVFFATSDELAVDVYNQWKKRDEVTTIIEN